MGRHAKVAIRAGCRIESSAAVGRLGPVPAGAGTAKASARASRQLERTCNVSKLEQKFRCWPLDGGRVEIDAIEEDHWLDSATGNVIVFPTGSG